MRTVMLFVLAGGIAGAIVGVWVAAALANTIRFVTGV
jgi:hypothetical protein